MKRIDGHSKSLDSSSNNILNTVASSSENIDEFSNGTYHLCTEITEISSAVEAIAQDMKLLDENGSLIVDASASRRNYTIKMKDRANEIRTLASNSKQEIAKFSVI